MIDAAGIFVAHPTRAAMALPPFPAAMTTTCSRHSLTACTIAAALMSCAPLTQPVQTAQTAPGAAAAHRSEATPLERYLEARASQTGADRYRPWIAVLPIVDDSGFEEGVWDMEHDLPGLLVEEMARSTSWHVIPHEVVWEVVGERPGRWRDTDLRRIGSTLEADVLMLGTLLDYNMERFHVGDPLVGGYKSYKGVAEIEISVLDGTDLSRVGSIHAREETLDRDLGLDLFGRPREQDVGFFTLDRIEFGGDEFRSTVIGQTTLKVIEEVIQKLASLLQPRGIQVSSGNPEILSVFGDEIYINVGSENGVHRGYRFAVYPGEKRQGELPSEQRIAVIEVREVISSRVSRVRAVSGEGVAIGDRIQLIMAEPE